MHNWYIFHRWLKWFGIPGPFGHSKCTQFSVTMHQTCIMSGIVYMEDMKQIKKVAVLPNILGPGSWEISYWWCTRVNKSSSLHNNVTWNANMDSNWWVLSCSGWTTLQGVLSLVDRLLAMAIMINCYLMSRLYMVQRLNIFNFRIMW